MLPYKSLITIDAKSTQPIYLQISSEITRLISDGIIQPGSRLPSSRSLSSDLGFHRKTILQAIDELEGQGWVDTIPYKGVYVVGNLPKVQHRKLSEERSQVLQKAGFSFHKSSILTNPLSTQHPLGFGDGVPDARLAPIRELATAYSRRLKMTPHNLLSYGSTLGTEYARQTIAHYLNSNRGLSISADNIILTRGSVMGIHLAAKLLLERNDTVVMGTPDYGTARMIFSEQGANVLHVPTDDRGIVVDLIQNHINAGVQIKAIYITPHHHYPTTVALSPDRRLKLLELAAEYSIAIIEDDYSYDFHYANAPILPLASADTVGSVIYIGSFSKALAPAFRVGYAVAPSEVISEMGKQRRIIDRQGDHILENAIADLIKDGTINRYKKKTVRVYAERLELFCQLFERYGLDEHARFFKPNGGMATWVTWCKHINLDHIRSAAAKQQMHFPDTHYYDPPGQNLRSMRMGFSNLNNEEMQQGFSILAELL